MGLLPKITGHALIRYVERVWKIKTSKTRRQLRPLIRWIDSCVDSAETVAEVDLFLELKKRLVEREILDRLEFMGVDFANVRAEIGALLANLPGWALKLIAGKHELNIRYRGLEFFFKEGRLTTLIVIGRPPARRLQGVAEMRALAREAAECFEDALAI